MYYRASEKGPLYYNYSHFITRIIFALYLAIITNKRIVVTEKSMLVIY